MVNLPDIPNPLDALKDQLPELFDELFGRVKRFFWEPLRGWFDEMHELADGTVNMATTVTAGFLRVASALESFWKEFPSYVAAAIIDGFEDWIDEVVDLIVDLIERTWED